MVNVQKGNVYTQQKQVLNTGQSLTTQCTDMIAKTEIKKGLLRQQPSDFNLAWLNKDKHKHAGTSKIWKKLVYITVSLLL